MKPLTPIIKRFMEGSSGVLKQSKGALITYDRIEAVMANGQYQVRGSVIGTTGRKPLAAGQTVPVAWKDGRPFVIIAHTARRAQFTTVSRQVVGGVVEELILAVDPKTNLIEVWFRNYNVLINLKLRESGILLEEPEPGNDGFWGQWGPTKWHFVIRTGTGSTLKYYIFSLKEKEDESPPDDIRNQILAPNVEPTIKLLRVERPGISSLALITVGASYELRMPALQRFHFTSTQHVFSPPPGSGCQLDSTLTAAPSVKPESIWIQTGSRTSLLSELIVNSGHVPYTLNDRAELIFLLAAVPVGVAFPTIANSGTKQHTPAPPGPPCNGTLDAATDTIDDVVDTRSERHLWVINLTTGAILFRTAQASATISRKLRAFPVTLGQTGFDTGTLTVNNEAPGCPGPPTQISCSVPSAGEYFDAAELDAGLNENGTKELLDSVWGALFASEDRTFGFADVITHPQVASVRNTIGVTEVSHIAFKEKLTTRTWSPTNDPISYSVGRATPIIGTKPLQFALVVDQFGPVSHTGFFIVDVGGNIIRTLHQFGDGTHTFSVITASKHFLLWRQTSPTTYYMTTLPDGPTKTLNAGNATALRLLRLLDPDFMYNTKENENTTGGFFVEFKDEAAVNTNAPGHPDHGPVTLDPASPEFPVDETALDEVALLADATDIDLDLLIYPGGPEGQFIPMRKSYQILSDPNVLAELGRFVED